VPSDQCEFEINSKIHDTGYENHVTLSGEQAPETMSSTAAITMYMKHCSRDTLWTSLNRSWPPTGRQVTMEHPG